MLILLFSAHCYIGQAIAAEQSVRKQIYARTAASVSADIARTAKRKNWQDYRVQMNIFIPSEISYYAPCHSPLQVADPDESRSDLARMRYVISCEDPHSWEVAVTVKPDIYLPIWVAKKSIERGKKITPNDIELKKRNISGLFGNYLTDPDEVVGFTVKRRIRDLQPLSVSHLEQPTLVTRGQQVLMIAEQEGVVAQMLGEVLKNGHKGDRVKVKNLSSGKTVNATVDGIGIVRMLVGPN
ncbi:flagellar basal body P-ring formation chaperone FlgA [Candidatus Fukatsuia symbiotica]|nr:flagellar basal body P-ring formation chaperone FlgA [Candidatus Fukatsuia symbiotica]MEA9444926.1 flagellar basal body P-ring formation chaperone FlgA [Candidatus Fukatsuia symbiotica]